METSPFRVGVMTGGRGTGTDRPGTTNLQPIGPRHACPDRRSGARVSRQRRACQATRMSISLDDCAALRYRVIRTAWRGLARLGVAWQGKARALRGMNGDEHGAENESAHSADSHGVLPHEQG